MSVRVHLERHGLISYAEAFDAQHVEVADLPGISPLELTEVFGIRNYGDRKRFMAMVEELRPRDSTLIGMLPGAADSMNVPAMVGSYRMF